MAKYIRYIGKTKITMEVEDFVLDFCIGIFTGIALYVAAFTSLALLGAKIIILLANGEGATKCYVNLKKS